nr:hypothetical protein GCM10020093_042210 [Planobispora longispora]
MLSWRRPAPEDPGMKGMEPDGTQTGTRQADAEPRLSAAYWRLWWATGVSTAGDGAFAAAVALLAVTVTRDPRLVSVVSAATYLPWLLLSLPAGALVDRYDRAASCGARRRSRP